MEKKAFKLEYLPIIVIFVLAYALRFIAGPPDDFHGNILSLVLFGIICIALLYFLLAGKADFYILTWIAFYFASPIIKIPFIEIGSLGILLGIFLPIMFLQVIDFKNKYFLLISLLLIYSLLNLSSVEIRIVISEIIELISPLIFFYYARKKCSGKEETIFNFSIAIALLYLPLVIYEAILRPEWGGLIDWRGFRIFGNLFWHNSYSFYLLPLIIITYARIRKTPGTIINYFILVILLAMNLFTLSRNGLLTLVLSLLVFESTLNSGFRITWKKIAIGVFLLACLALYQFYLSPKLDFHLSTETLEERTAIWETIIPLMKDHLVFGRGVGSYELFRDQVLKSLSTHNYYIFIVFQIGIVGLMIDALFIALILYHLHRSIKPEREFYASEVGIAIIAGILIYSMIGNSAFTHVVAMNAWVILGCCVTYNEKN